MIYEFTIYRSRVNHYEPKKKKKRVKREMQPQLWRGTQT